MDVHSTDKEWFKYFTLKSYCYYTNKIIVEIL